ncbi:MAG TPA: nucleotidyltransferase domain-containing protein [Fimbriimonadaceae bacterium]|nr:nucleotidyltransferase domain-containing protein [Fimbriimonadaceae bacterium]
MHTMARACLEAARQDLESLCRRFGVSRLWVFGSALSERWEPASSDLDFLVEFGPPPKGVDLFAQQFVLQVELERLLGRRVDLVDRTAIRRPLFREKVEREKQEVYAA